jgi:hypothetical protein
MENIFGGGAIGLYLFLYLLPGLFGTLVYEYVIEGERRDVLDRIATALVLALISYLALHFIAGENVVPRVEVRSDTPLNVILDAFLEPAHLFWATIISTGVAAIFAVAQNHGWIYAALRQLRMTRKTGESDVWQQTFYLYFDRWISLEFKDGRRLVGWPQRFSSSGQRRALLVGDATWYSQSEDRAITSQDVRGPGVYVENFDEIVSIEVLD